MIISILKHCKNEEEMKKIIQSIVNNICTYEDIREEGIEVDMYFLSIFSPEAQQKIIELVIIESWEDCDFE